MALLTSILNLGCALTLFAPAAMASQVKAPTEAPSAPSTASDALPNFGVIDPATWVTEGTVVPELELPMVDGSGVFDLASLRGKKVLLIQFASW